MSIRDPKQWLRVRVLESGNGCHEWQRSVNACGYGTLGVRWTRETLAHRASYEIHCGPIPSGMQVLHKCDNPPCCNPDHLFLGTPRENSDDKVRKGRQARVKGSHSGNAKLNEVRVARVRIMLEHGVTQARLAKHFGVSKTLISNIALGKSWAHVEPVACQQ